MFPISIGTANCRISFSGFPLIILVVRLTDINTLPMAANAACMNFFIAGFYIKKTARVRITVYYL